MPQKKLTPAEKAARRARVKEKLAHEQERYRKRAEKLAREDKFYAVMGGCGVTGTARMLRPLDATAPTQEVQQAPARETPSP